MIDVEPVLPQQFARTGVQADHHLLLGDPLPRTTDDVNPAVDDHRRRTNRDLGVPDLPGAIRRPGGDQPSLSGHPILIGAAPARPVLGIGDQMQAQDGHRQERYPPRETAPDPSLANKVEGMQFSHGIGTLRFMLDVTAHYALAGVPPEIGAIRNRP